ncbi:50S ribosomal protein L28 chloroplastic [Zea mays]|uniref:50S ribosomal protein L28 chloroplastic n=1 Tax=Zea mays TaxID=4577 RepID=A0A1D6LYR7_MAIZE|nr:50S ribosomal protein L28 chloroplastic [Zea mays]
MATATLLGSSFAIPAAARRASSSASTSLGFATSQLAGLSLSAGAATPTAVAFLPKRQQLQPLSRGGCALSRARRRTGRTRCPSPTTRRRSSSS